MTEEHLREMEEGGIYDFICNHYTDLDRFELKEIACEMIWQLEQTNGDYIKATKLTVEALRENYLD